MHRATDVDMTGALRNEHVTGDARMLASLFAAE